VNKKEQLGRNMFTHSV